ncbi:hypothetical protein D1159_14040 [Pseudoflavonifractor sp. 524-17]|uniref:SpaA isopeptide-forming pilin-related protein n=1 Tax=Pseudoflavonifractor sp. 524-17 TaxID=2304577 RepID=UPI00137B3C06|nr:SpaA isopeptide-forming pilin-related protein [Pseudoflavonifractor sp. 524-17]NCE65665.1 hypothetical protein [Pseudoflavonifractor sp. 524-17]
MKRLTSMILALSMLFSLLCPAVQAASTPGEALGKVDIYSGGYPMAYLAVNGKVQTQEYTYFLYSDETTGEEKEIPAYCVNPNLYGVPQTVGKGESIEYLADEKAADPKVVGIIANCYPHRGLAELKLDSLHQAFYAGKIALWCYLIPEWDISKVTINPALTGAERDRAERIKAAAADIYNRGMAWNSIPQPRLAAVADQETAYPVTIDGAAYLQQVFTVTSDTWVNQYAVHIALQGDVPSGTRIADMDNKDITTLKVAGSSGVFQGQFKVLYPAASVEGKRGSVQFSLSADVYQYAVFYAVCQEADEYGPLQNYLCDTDPRTSLLRSGVSRYAPDPTPEETPPPSQPPQSGELEIVKYEQGTDLPLEGAAFEVKGPDGDVMGVFTTGADGRIRVPAPKAGSYTVREVTPPKYHLLDDEPTKTVTVRPGETARLTYHNPPYGDLRIEKVDGATGNSLAGARIQIKHIESGKTYTGVTDTGGSYTFTELVPGAYEIQELAAPEGWERDPQTHTTTVATGECVTYTLKNSALPGLKLTKYDAASHAAMSGVTFEIFQDTVSIGRYETDALGEILLTNLQPGTYRVVEVDTGNTTHLIAPPQEVLLTAGGGIKELIFTNDQKPGMRLVKVDSTDPSKVIPNVRFEISQVGGSYKNEFVTDRNGEIDLSALEPGAYQVKELEAPAGYLLDDAARTIQLRPNETAEFVFTNTPMPSLRLVKLSSGGSRLQGVTFRIAKIEDGTHYLDRTTDENGEINLSGLEPGVYSVKETATVSDHILNPKEYHVELFPGKTSTITIENQKRPNLTIYKRDADTGEPIPNTVFLVKAADGHSVNEVKTGADGKAELENLLPGVYEISEKSVPAPWLLDAAPQLVTLYPNRDRAVYFENHKRPTLTIHKVDSVTGSPIQGAKFEVWYGSNSTNTGELNSLGAYFSDENGQIVIDNLRDGWYKVTELEPAAGFSIKEPATQEFYIKGGESKTITFENVPLNAIIIEKYDSVTGEALPGCTFQLKYLGGTSGTGGTVIGTKVTGKNGTAIWTGLKPGTYVAEEVDPADGYSIIQSSETILLADSGEQSVITVRFANAPDGALLIRKVCATNPSVTLQNAEFKVAYADGTLIGDSNGIFRTDEHGEIRIPGLKPGKSVVVTETRAPAGFILDTQSQTVQIKAGKTVSLTFKNQPKGSLIIQKRDSATDQPLPGAQFRITTAAGCEVGLDGVIGSSTLTQNGIFTTDSSGEIRITNLAPGAYVVNEIKAPVGYVMDSPSTNVVIGQGGDTQTVVIKNSKAGTLVIDKRDSLTGKPLAGVTFKVTTSTGEFVPDANGQISSNGLYTTDKDGKIIINGVVGTLVVTETATIPGYTIDEAARTQTVHVNPNGTQTLRFTNTPSTTLVIEKYIEGTTTPLKGVTFLVTDSSGEVVGGSNGAFITDENGRIVIGDLEPGTTVTAREVKTLEGFVLDTTPKSIKIKAGEAQTLRFYNARQGTIVIKKLDKQTGKPLAGVEFQITYADGSYLDDDYGHLSSKGLYTTGRNGEIRISGVVGTLVITETKPLPGYVMDTETRTQTVKVNPADTQTVTFYNTRSGGVEIIKVSESDRTRRIPNVTFEIRKMDGGLMKTVTTDSKGRVYQELDAGHYYAVEIDCPKEFRLDGTPHYFEVKDGETTALTVENRPFSGILLHKVDSVTGKGIHGVTFLLYDGSMNPVDQFTTDQDGYAYIDTLELSGKVYLRELENEGYAVDTQLKTVYIKPGETTEITWKNTPITAQIQITKKSAGYNPTNGLPAGTLLEGAVFEICDKAGNVVDTIRSDQRGLAASKPLPLDRYTVREVKAPDHYGVNDTVLTAYLEHPGQIVRFEVTNQSLTTGVSITKTGPKEAMAGQPVNYTFSGIANTSNVRLENFYWRDTLPAQVQLDTVVTGTYNFPGTYKITYRVNGGEPRTLADSLSTAKNYTLAASPAALGLAANERVTEIMFVFGQAPAKFSQVEKPILRCTALKHIAAVSFVNVADVGGTYNGKWVQAISRWVTAVYGKPSTLPRTGY